VLHGPRFSASSVLGRAQACWAVVRRLVGKMSALIAGSRSNHARPSEHD